MAVPGQASSADVLKLATTTSLENSGLLDHLVPIFEAETKIKIHIIPVGTGRALTLARGGDVDLLWVHSPKDEMEFVQQGYGIKRTEVMYNYFMLVGPFGGKKIFKNARDITAVLDTIQQKQYLFISRGDLSGTHKKEMILWEKLNSPIKKTKKWYLETGMGMGKTLIMAYEKNAYTLSDEGTFLNFKHKFKNFGQVFFGKKEMHNLYSLIIVNPAKIPQVKVNQALTFRQWIIGKKAQSLIKNYTKKGKRCFFPLHMK